MTKRERGTMYHLNVAAQQPLPTYFPSPTSHCGGQRPVSNLPILPYSSTWLYEPVWPMGHKEKSSKELLGNQEIDKQGEVFGPFPFLLP